LHRALALGFGIPVPGVDHHADLRPHHGSHQNVRCFDTLRTGACAAGPASFPRSGSAAVGSADGCGSGSRTAAVADGFALRMPSQEAMPRPGRIEASIKTALFLGSPLPSPRSANRTVRPGARGGRSRAPCRRILQEAVGGDLVGSWALPPTVGCGFGECKGSAAGLPNEIRKKMTRGLARGASEFPGTL